MDKTVCVLVEKNFKKTDTQWSGRTTQNTVVVFPKGNYKIGDFVDVKIKECTSATLIGEAVGYSKAFNHGFITKHKTTIWNYWKQYWP